MSRTEKSRFPLRAEDMKRLNVMIDQSRIDRLNEVREALSTNTYQVSGREIARALIQWKKRKGVRALLS